MAREKKTKKREKIKNSENNTEKNDKNMSEKIDKNSYNTSRFYVHIKN